MKKEKKKQLQINLLLLLIQDKTIIRNSEVYTTHFNIKCVEECFVQLGLNEADMFKFSSTLFNWVTDESILYTKKRLDAMLN